MFFTRITIRILQSFGFERIWISIRIQVHNTAYKKDCSLSNKKRHIGQQFTCKQKDTLDNNLPIRSAGAALACLDVLYEALVLLVLVLLLLVLLLLALLVLLLVLVLLLLLQVEPLYGGLRPRGQPYSLLDGHVGHKPEQTNLSTSEIGDARTIIRCVPEQCVPKRSVLWTMRPLDDAALGYCVPWTCRPRRSIRVLVHVNPALF
jgi:hypothetical protein